MQRIAPTICRGALISRAPPRARLPFDSSRSSSIAQLSGRGTLAGSSARRTGIESLPAAPLYPRAWSTLACPFAAHGHVLAAGASAPATARSISCTFAALRLRVRAILRIQSVPEGSIPFLLAHSKGHSAWRYSIVLTTSDQCGSDYSDALSYSLSSQRVRPLCVPLTHRRLLFGGC